MPIYFRHFFRLFTWTALYNVGQIWTQITDRYAFTGLFWTASDDRITDPLSAIEMFGIASNKPLVLVGGPPCQGFSSHKKKDKRKDNRNSLVARNVELGIESGSDVIILANVSDLFANKHWELYSEAEAMLEEDGDIITSSVLSLAEYGVPQERFRAVVVASKKKTNSAAQ